MLNIKDPVITLFGMKISLPTENDAMITSSDKKKSKRVEHEADIKIVKQEEADTVQQNEASLSKDEEAKQLEPLVETYLNPRTSSGDEECPKGPKPKDIKTEEKQDKAATTQYKFLKKPEKILPCPRCNSMDTKFCYYNNYNANQPRHFCKACQRYWTAGGSMRNVPVGAGRRNRKNSSSHFGLMTITEALRAARFDLPIGTGHVALENNGKVLSFGLDSPICESMASILNLADKKVVNGTLNGFHNHDVQKVKVPGKSGEIGDECSSGSSSASEEGGRSSREPLMKNINGSAQMPCLHGVPWPYPWHSAASSPVFCPPGYPMPFHAPAFWNGSFPSPLGSPWWSPNSQSSQKSLSYCPSSPLGKHSREGDILKPVDPHDEDRCQKKTPKRCIMVPETLRIDDLAEAAKSSFWATLGIKNEPVGIGGMFMGFESKSDGKKLVADPSPVLQANPAALSRSLKFHECV